MNKCKYHNPKSPRKVIDKLIADPNKTYKYQVYHQDLKRRVYYWCCRECNLYLAGPFIDD